MQADPQQDILGPKMKNYQFLKLVREKQYGPALLLGKQILKQSPDNVSVQKFVDFIQKNAKKLDEMVKEEEEYESAHSSDSSEESQEQQEGQKGQQKDSVGSQSDDSKEQQEQPQQQQKPEKKIELTTCTLNSIPHVCPRHHKLIIEAATQGKI